ncbi:thioredoxin-like protein [Melanomma pulvis-pyrius CBS 109.77]|uniref:Thioredoxin-like protein n=1 Tax=Melanomma pulvis-pyrius CBS 109.77 TaxID=1314802 RepID=A0A6A6XPH9_9PLEO|nr:thioredoxin-like protein [Melanomma pulvis-pyrius CBS 109.77]
MPYESTITFTLDVICPWTYLAYLRLTRALTLYNASAPHPPPATFTLHLAPYQLYPSASKEGTEKYTWYLNEKYAGSAEKMDMYTKYMAELGRKEGIAFDFHGPMANSFDALRVLMYVQAQHGEGAARKTLESLYAQYFTQRAHPSSHETLMAACRAAGLEDGEAERVVAGEEVGRREVERGVREQRGDGVDSVPYVVFEGRKRDFTLVGAREVEEYVKTLEAVAKEC